MICFQGTQYLTMDVTVSSAHLVILRTSQQYIAGRATAKSGYGYQCS